MKRKERPLLWAALLCVTAGLGRADQNLLKNGGFEAGAEGWSVDSSFAPAELVVLTGEAGKEVFSGQKALLVRNPGVRSSLHRSAGKAGVDYELSFMARSAGDVTTAEGAAFTSKVGVGVFTYGRPEERGYSIFLNTMMRLNPQPVGPEWREIRTPLKVTEAEVPGVKEFRLVLFVEGAVVLDDVRLVERETWRDGLLFHLPFDDGLAPATAARASDGETVGQVRLVEGRKGKAASFTDNAHLVLKAEGNFDQAEGTIAMWIKPYWSEYDSMAHCFFEVPGPGEHATNPDAGFTVTKGWTPGNTPNLCYFHSGTADWVWGDHIGGFAFGFVPNEWVHVAFSWSASAGLYPF